MKPGFSPLGISNGNASPNLNVPYDVVLGALGVGGINGTIGGVVVDVLFNAPT